MNASIARNVIIKGLSLFVLLNALFAWTDPLPVMGRFSAYNHLFPGRVRLPYADNPEKAYSLSLYNLEAMFASHEISSHPKSVDEFRIILLGDSATWGFLLPPQDTLAAYMNRVAPLLPDGRRVKVYNIGYPIMSLTKDLLLLSYAHCYQPDLIVWLVTLESFPYEKQLFPPLLQNNRQPVVNLINTYGLKLDAEHPAFQESSFWQRTIIGSRRQLADWFRLQFYGVLWAATGIDQEIPEVYTPRQEDLSAELAYYGLTPPTLNEADLALDVLIAGHQLAGPIPLILINEPMFISQGLNSDLRYNFYYPRWAYDSYRLIMQAKSIDEGWIYYDFWDIIPLTEFTNSAVHLSPAGSRLLAENVMQAVQEKISAQNQKE